MGELFSIFLSSVFVNNLMLRQFLGVSPYTLLCRNIETAFAMGAALTTVMISSTLVSWYIYNNVLELFGIEYLYILAFVIVVLVMTYLTELLFKKALPAAYASLENFLPSIAANCAVLGLVILNIRKGYGLTESLAHSLGAAVGFSMALLLIAGIMGRLHLNGENKYFQGVAEALIIASILSLIFQLFMF